MSEKEKIDCIAEALFCVVDFISHAHIKDYPNWKLEKAKLLLNNVLDKSKQKEQ